MIFRATAVYSPCLLKVKLLQKSIQMSKSNQIGKKKLYQTPVDSIEYNEMFRNEHSNGF